MLNDQVFPPSLSLISNYSYSSTRRATALARAVSCRIVDANGHSYYYPNATVVIAAEPDPLDGLKDRSSLTFK
jgi:hypothetical protein